jgi:lipopolysaccharide biosynthesis protein
MESVTFVIHLYYPGSWKLITRSCGPVLEKAARIIITACHDDVILEVGRRDNTTILKVPNKGKDIGGKLAGLSYYLNFCPRTDYLAFLHDKISPQTINSDYWFEKLYGIFQENAFFRNLNFFRKNPKTGVLGSKAFIMNEYASSRQEFNTTNNTLLKKLISRYNLKCRSYDFVAGTIFIIRSKIFEKFFSFYSPLDARNELEKGNVLDLQQGTYTHSWERLFCFIAEAQGYKIAGA